MSEPATAVETPVPAPDAPPVRLAGARPAAIAFLLTTALPLVAYLAGVRAAVVENRPATGPPAISELAALDDAALEQLTDHLVDTVPGRQAAVRADAWIDLHAFGVSPSDEVLLGEDGWNFLETTVTAPCRRPDQVRRLRAELGRAAALVAWTGRRLATTIAPDKATIYPDRLPASVPDDACGQVFGRALRETVEQDPPLGYVPFWDRLEALRDTAGAPIYFDADTHWRTDGSLVMVEALVGALRPELLEAATTRRREPTSFTADLSLLMGLPREVTEQPLVVDRPGVAWRLRRADSVPEAPEDLPRIDISVLEATGAAVVPGRVVMLHDSFAYMARPQLAPFFAELMMVRKHPLTVPWVGELAASAETLLFEAVEREAWARIMGDRLTASLAAALRDDLPHETVSPVADGAGWVTADPDRAEVVVAVGGGLAELGPYRLQLRGADGAVDTYPSQVDVRPGADLVFDLGRRSPRGPVGLRIVDRNGAVVPITELVFVRTP